MTLSRRGFLGGILAGAAAPAIVRASSLMPIVAPKIWTPPLDNLCGRFVIGNGDQAEGRMTGNLWSCSDGMYTERLRSDTKYMVHIDELYVYEVRGQEFEWTRINPMNVELRHAHRERAKPKPSPQIVDLVFKRLKQLIGPTFKA